MLVETVRTSLDNRSLTNTGSERQLLPVETVRASVYNRLSDLNSSVHYGILPFAVLFNDILMSKFILENAVLSFLAGVSHRDAGIGLGTFPTPWSV